MYNDHPSRKDKPEEHISQTPWISGGPCICVMPCDPPDEEEEVGYWPASITIESEPYRPTAVERLATCDLDIYAHTLTDAALFAIVDANPDIDYVKSFGSHNEFSFNPVPFFTDGRFNPFGIPRIREAMNWLIDRDYIANEILGGLAVPKYTVLNAEFADARDRYPDLVEAIEYYYGYQPEHAFDVIATEMLAQGAYIDDTTGTWHDDGEELEIILLIQKGDHREELGYYLGDQLERIGFRVAYDFKTAGDADAIWLHGDPACGEFHIYTGGGVATVSRDQGGDFAFFYTDMGPPVPLWQAYDTDPVFYEVSHKLNQNLFTSMQEREQLFEQALWLAMKDSVRIWLTDNRGFSALKKNVGLAADWAGGIEGSWMWAHTVHFKDACGNPAVGGNLRVAVPSILRQPANPIAGSNWEYDMFWIRATGDAGWAIDVRDGLRWPHNFEKAEVTVQTGLPVGVSTDLGHDWVTLSFAPSIAVPGDAWADWDAATQQFIPASTRFPGGTTALRKSVVYYPKDIFETPIHDGSTLSMGDFIIGAILSFDRAKEASPIYDSSAVPSFNSFMSAFKGVRFITDNPEYGLIVETYSDDWTMDAELCVSTWWPVYAQGPAVWHTLAVGIRAEADKQLAFSSPKATALGVEWTSFIAGPSLAYLSMYLGDAKATNYIPYEPTMGLYVSQSEAAERWSNLEEWYAAKGHFWVGSGPYCLESVDLIQKMIHLERFENYPDPRDMWLFLLDPLP